MRVIFTLLIFINSIAAFAQAPYLYFNRINADNGLSHNKVNCLLQDKRGFIWIGTEKGLQRFDGLRFINYQPEFSNANNTHTSPINLYADNNCLWLSANSQLKNLGFFTNKITG